MAKRLLIKTSDDCLVHFDRGYNCWTLCGLETQGDSEMGIMEGQPTTRKVNCPHCIEITDYCKQIRLREYKKGY